MTALEPITPGEILKEEFLIPMNITAYKLAKETCIPQSRISNIINGKRGISADSAMRFSVYFGTTPEFWLNIQNQYDLDVIKSSDRIIQISNINPLNQMQG